MKAVVLTRTDAIENHPLEIRDVPTPRPGPGEILLRVTACGVCRSNLHMIEGEWARAGIPAKLPIIPGHEIVGVIEALGEGVASFAVGDRAGIQPLWSTCGDCEFCLSGREQLCQRKQITGETVDGGYAEFVVGRAEHTYRLPEAISDEVAAPLFCPGITAYGAISKLRLRPGQRVAVFGMGGVGHLVVQIARLHGAEVVVVSRGAEHLRLAHELGAEQTIDATAMDPAHELRRMGGADAAVVFAPSSDVVKQALRGIKPGGTVVIGAAAELGRFPFPEEKTIVGSLLGTRQQMREVLELAAAGRITSIFEAFPLDRAEEALTRLKRGELAARAVLVP